MIFLNYNDDLTDATLVNNLQTMSWYNLPDAWKETAYDAYVYPDNIYVLTINNSNQVAIHKLDVERCGECSWPASLCFCE